MSGVAFPYNTAFAFAARTRNELALGPAPQSIYLFVISGDASPGLVLCTNFTAKSIILSETGTLRIRF